MALIVQKFGGTSVGSVERIRNVARRVAKWRTAGHDIVAVPSALAGETVRLLALAKEVPARHEPTGLYVDPATCCHIRTGLTDNADAATTGSTRCYDHCPSC